jgi:predicted transcriptional regulator
MEGLMTNHPSRGFSPTDASALLGIPYAAVLRYAKELEKRGLIQARRERNGRVFFSRENLDQLRHHHEHHPSCSRFRAEGEVDHNRHVSEIDTIASNLEAMAIRARTLADRLKKAPGISTIWIATLPATRLSLRRPLPVSVITDGKAFSAFSADTGSTASGRNRVDAVRALRRCVALEYLYLQELAALATPEELERLADLKNLIQDDDDLTPSRTRATSRP